MFFSRATILFVCFWFNAAKASSFYDNPEQDPLPLEDTPEDLYNKWNFEVNSVSLIFQHGFTLLRELEIHEPQV